MGRRTPLYDVHVALGARMVDFAGWDMPLSYRGAAEEHRAVRERCGLFDVSHMGEIELRGPAAAAVCQELTVNDVRRLRIGDGQYTVLCNERGGVLDDLIVFRLGPERYLLIVNAANAAADYAWICDRAGQRAVVIDRSAELGLLALQGPEAELALRTLTTLDLGGRAGSHAAARRAPGGAQSPRHAPPGGRPAALRDRHGRDDHAARGGPCLGGEARQGRLRRPRGAGRAGRPRRHAPPGRPRARGARRPAPRLRRLAERCRRGHRHQRHPVTHPRHLHRPRLRHRRGGGTRHAGRGRDPRAPRPGAGSRASVLSPGTAGGVSMELPDDLRYTKEHEWLRLEGDDGVVGITDFAQDALGDVVFVELPAVGATFAQGQVFGVVESNKTVSDLFAPVSGRVIAVNQVLRDEPEHVNADPYGAGWMIRLAVARRDEVDALLDAAAYRAHIAREQGK